ncbi:MAG: Hsp20/alpha crystallin family protein [Clostridiales bacterium]|nr:Hsp20/alpha crystallin family protein [Clostridiales bacterium]
MFALTPFNRRNDSLTVRNDLFDMNRIFDDFFGGAFVPAYLPENPMKADIRETEKEYLIEAEIPGVRKEDIRLELDNDVLTLSVERKEEVNEEKDNYIRKERRYGSYSRSFRVGNVKNEAVAAKYNDGILTVTIPKSEVDQPRDKRIEIQ